MSDTSVLPAGFGDLEHYVDAWSLKGQRARYNRMLEVDIQALRQFYQTMLPRMDAIITHLNRFPLDAMPEPEQHLMDLALTFAETAHPVDFKWKATQFDDVFPFDRVRLTSASEAW
jgi:hypothetical protein